MDDAQRLAVLVLDVVDVGQRVRDLGDHVQRDPLRHHAVVTRKRDRAQGIDPVDELHRQEGGAVDEAVVHDLHDAAVVQARADARLVEKHAPAAVVAQMLRE